MEVMLMTLKEQASSFRRSVNTDVYVWYRHTYIPSSSSISFSLTHGKYARNKAVLLRRDN